MSACTGSWKQMTRIHRVAVTIHAQQQCWLQIFGPLFQPIVSLSDVQGPVVLFYFLSICSFSLDASIYFPRAISNLIDELALVLGQIKWCMTEQNRSVSNSIRNGKSTLTSYFSPSSLLFERYIQILLGFLFFFFFSPWYKPMFWMEVLKPGKHYCNCLL